MVSICCCVAQGAKVNTAILQLVAFFSNNTIALILMEEHFLKNVFNDKIAHAFSLETSGLMHNFIFCPFFSLSADNSNGWTQTLDQGIPKGEVSLY